MLRVKRNGTKSRTPKANHYVDARSMTQSGPSISAWGKASQHMKVARAPYQRMGWQVRGVASSRELETSLLTEVPAIAG